MSKTYPRLSEICSNETTLDYRYAVAGIGDTLSRSNWQDKKHRNIYDLCEELESIHEELKNFQHDEQDKHIVSRVKKLVDFYNASQRPIELMFVDEYILISTELLAYYNAINAYRSLYHTIDCISFISLLNFKDNK